MLLDLKVSIGTLGIGFGAFIAALYGMNLKNFLEESDFGFMGVSGASFIFAAVVGAYGLTKLRKLQRVRMWGEEERKSRDRRGEARGQRLKRLGEHETLKGVETVEALPPVLKQRP